jgi:hypothetical protein
MTNCSFLGSECGTWASMLFLAALSVGIWATWYFFLLGRGKRTLFSLVGGQLFSLAQIILTQMALGLMYLLYPIPLGVLNIGILLTVWYFGIRPAWTAIRNAQREEWIAFRTTPFSRISRLLLLLFALALARSFMQAFFLPPREWDGLVYHLTIMADFYQAHAVYPMDSLIVWVRTYPFNGELLSLWNLIFLGVDKFVDMPFLVSIGAGAFAVYGIARKMGASREAAIAGSAVFAFAPAILIQQVSTHSDAFLAAVFAMGVFAILPENQEEDEVANPRRLAFPVLCAGMAMGILAGTKYTGVYYAAGIGALLLFRCVPALRAQLPASKKRMIGALFTIAMGTGLLLCGYPYIRNAIRYANPLAPFSVQIGNWTLFPGDRERDQIISDNTSESDLALTLPVRVAKLWMEPYDTIYNEQTSGLGPLWICLALPALAVWTAHLLRKRNWAGIIFLSASVIALLATPAFWVPRYGAPILVAGSVATAWLLDAMRPKFRMVLRAIIVGCALFLWFVTLDLVQISPKVFLDYLAQRTDATRSSVPFLWYGRNVFQKIDSRTSVKPGVVAFGGLVRFAYPLFGPDFRNRVIDLPTQDEQTWREMLDAYPVGYVVVMRGKVQYEWMLSNHKYRQDLEDDGCVLFIRE